MKGLFSYPESKDLYGIFNDSFPPILDGVTLAVENYVYWLSRKGHTPCVVTPWNPEKQDYPFEVVRYFSLPIASRHPYRYCYPKCDPFIWRRLRKSNFKILHSHCPFSSGRLAVYVKKHQKVPLIGTFHSKYRSDLEHSFRKAPWCVPIIMKRILDFFNSCDEVWIPQAQVEETVREYGFKGPLTVVENGNDFASIITGNPAEYKLAARHRLGVKDDELALLFVGQHIWEKGIDVILETLRLLKGEIKFVMNFIGTGYALNDVRSLVSRYGMSDSVHINGVIKDRHTLSDYYAASDLFLFPSFYDNAPLVVREAAAMGTPAILLEGSTAAEVICDRKNGFLTEKSPERFSELIIHLKNNRDLLNRVSEGARTTLVRSWEDVVDEVSDRYDSLIRRYKV